MINQSVICIPDNIVLYILLDTIIYVYKVREIYLMAVGMAILSSN